MLFHIRLAALIALLFWAPLPHFGLALAAEPPRPPGGIDQALVKYRDVQGVARGGVNAPLPTYRWLALQAQAAKFNVRLTFVRNTALGAHVIKLDRPLGAQEAIALFDAFKASDPLFEYAEPDELQAGMQRAYHPNDPVFVPYNWNLNDIHGIRAREAWDEEWHGWIKEGDKFFLPGPSLVRYGEYGRAGDPVVRWTYKLLDKGDPECSYGTFGDPWDGVRKRCEVAKYWMLMASETQSFTLPGTSERWVRYGWGDSWAYKKLKGTVECSNATFGDPLRNTSKICQIEDRTDGGGILATETGQFYVAAPTVVRYGSISRTDGIGRWRYKLVPKGYNDCNTQAFGGIDPYQNVEKRCERVRNMGEGARVAIVDSGYLPHRELDINTDLDNSFDMVSDVGANNGDGRDPFPYEPSSGRCPSGTTDPTYIRSHALMMGSIIAAEINNGEFGAGIAPFATLQYVRVMSSCGTRSSDIVDGLIWAVGGVVPSDGFTVLPSNQKPVRVVNLSGGRTRRCDSESQLAIDFLRSRNAILVNAAGNSGTDTVESSNWPANCNGVVTVAATSRDGARYYASSFGANVALSAPGEAIPVLSVDAAGSPLVESVGGTSVAAAHVSAVAALMMSKNPKLTGMNVEHRLKLSARPFPKPCTGCGAGILDAARAMESAEAITDEQEPNDLSFPNHVTAPADIAGSADHPTDFDYYSLNLPPGATLKVQLVEGSQSFKVILQDPQENYRPVATLDDPKVGMSWPNVGKTTRRMLVRVASAGAAGAKYRLTLQW